jgi:hypothetical protein
MIALEEAPLPLLGIEMGTVTGQGDDFQPVGARRQRGLAALTDMTGTVVEDEDDDASGRRVPRIERG